MKLEYLNKSVVQFVTLLVALASVFIIILGIQSIAYLINSILLAVLITLAVLPIPKKLVARGMRSSLALIITLLVVVGVLVAIFMMAFASVNNIADSLQSPPVVESTSVTETALDLETTPVEVEIVLEDVVTRVEAVVNPVTLWSRIQNVVSPETLSQILGAVVSVFGQFAAQFFIVMLIFVFMLSAVIAAPNSEQLASVTSRPYFERFSDLTADVQRYISITTLINFLVGLGDTLLLFILDVPFAVLWGILAWIMGYIPVVGFWLAFIPPFLIAWVTLGLPTALVVVLGYVLINGSVENLIKPRIMGEGLNISPLVVFISIFIWGWILGGAGAIVAIPMTLLIISVLDSFDATKWIVVLMRPSSESEEHELKEADSRLREMWGRAAEVVAGSDDVSETSITQNLDAYESEEE